MEQEFLYLVFKIRNSYFGIDALKVQEIIKLPSITKVPNQQHGVRGLINFRSKVIPLLDMREKFSINSMSEEISSLISNLKNMEVAHDNYVEELKDSIFNNNKFTKSFDPKACTFGKWFYSFQSDNIILANLMQDFEVPHNQIHELAKEACNLKEHKRIDEAVSLINKESGKRLSTISNLFQELYPQVANTFSELALVYELDDKIIAFSFDSVYKIAKVNSSDIKPLTDNLQNDAFDGIAEVDDIMCILLNKKIFTENIDGLNLEYEFQS